jgi:hypothetical protein
VGIVEKQCGIRAKMAGADNKNTTPLLSYVSELRNISSVCIREVEDYRPNLPPSRGSIKFYVSMVAC